MAASIGRREFVATFGAAAMWPHAGRAQRPAMPTIGFLNSASADLYAPRARAFQQGLGEAGYVAGRNVTIEYRWAEGHYDRLPALAADLVSRNVAVIAASGAATSAMTAKAATETIPIVFQLGNNPVEAGLVASLSRPGGNLTGVTTLAAESMQKRLQLMHEIVPMAPLTAVLVNPTNPAAATQSRDLEAAVRTLGLSVRVLHASNERDLNTAFATLVQLRAGALVIGADSFLSSKNEPLAALALRHALPAIHTYREFAAAGGLMSYGSSTTEMYRIVGNYAGRILNGEKPADMPVHQDDKVNLIINMKTAKALGLTIPSALLRRADEVIE